MLSPLPPRPRPEPRERHASHPRPESRGPSEPRPPSRPSTARTSSAASTAPKYCWAGAATPTQRSVTQASATTERLDNDMFKGTPLAGKGNPTWPFSNTLTPWRNDLLRQPAPRPHRRAGELRLAARPLAPAGAAVTEISVWLADIPRRIGARLFLDSDEEAYWRGWQVTRLHGGLSRSYRDPRFDTRSAPPEPSGQAPLGQAPPDGDR
jgi:hypothetical protein